MKIKHYLYNAFIIEWSDKKIAIDPGGLFFYYFRFTTLIPKSDWNDITHIFVTHGDPDHYWHLDRVAEASNAPVICNKTMLKYVNGKALILGPRDKGLAFTKHVKNVHTLSVDETIKLDGMSITGLKTTHGPLTIKMGPFTKTEKTGPNERLGWGAIGFQISFKGRSIVNLGDTLLHRHEWQRIKNPDVLMIPIGGKAVHNTMDEKEALEAVRDIKPKLVIPCHYDCPAMFTKKINPADDKMFKKEVEKMGIDCVILRQGDSLVNL
jgi:L-ascorbate metabolism protein UlaG (beta-lactamase superfamily)